MHTELTSRTHRAARYILAGGSALLASSGCAVFMAMDQPEQKDLSVLAPGTPRGAVIAVVGPPKWTGEENGIRSDIFTFKEGSSQFAKLLRAGFHLSADAFTFGLWEPFGMLVEKQFTGPDIAVQVYYDGQDRVQTAKVLSGQGVVLAKTSTDGASPTLKVPVSVSVMPVLMPHPIAYLPQRLAVVSSTGSLPSPIASALDLTLAYLRTFHPDLAIVEREAQEPLTQELMLQQSGRVGDDTSVRIGAWKGADALLILRIDVPSGEQLPAVAARGGDVSRSVAIRLVHVETGLNLFQQTSTATALVPAPAFPSTWPEEMTERVQRDTLRVALAYSLAALAAAFGDNPLGVVPDLSSGSEGIGVLGVLHGGPAHLAGLKQGDRIIAVNEVPFRSVTQRVTLPALLTVERDGQRRTELIRGRA